MTNIFVGNLSFRTTQDELHQVFSAYGAVERVNLISDRDSGQSRGFAFVEMPNANEAEAAINALNGTNLGGRNINVNVARPRTEGGGGGGGGFRGGRGGGGGGRGGNRGGGGGGRW
jgi:RNA recognition motif-containing protein